MTSPESRNEPLTAEEWLLHAIGGLLSLQRLFIADGYKRDSSLISGLETALSQINEAVLLLRSETGDRQKLLAKACDAAFAFIDSHVADPDLTDEMIVKHAAYIEARRALEGTP